MGEPAIYNLQIVMIKGESSMQALVYHGPGKLALENEPKLVIKSPTDTIIKITKTIICGTDLHMQRILI